MIVSPLGQIDATHYVDPKTNQVFQVNLDSLEIVGAGVPSGLTANIQTDDYRKAIEAAVDFYAGSFYGAETYTSAVYAKDGIITIVISARNFRLNAMWAGGWTSTYTLPVNKQGVVDIKGSIKLNVHYFEDGNVQLNSTFNKESSIRVENAENTAKAVGACIEKLESEYHKQLEEFYVNMNVVTFKAMRRFLPLTQKKFEWNANAHKLASEMK